MNALSLRSLERAVLDAHEKRITSTRGADLPKHEVDRSLPKLREVSAAVRDEQLSRIAALRHQGLTGKQLAEAAEVTERRLYWLEAWQRKAESLKVTP